MKGNYLRNKTPLLNGTTKPPAATMKVKNHFTPELYDRGFCMDGTTHNHGRYLANGPDFLLLSLGEQSIEGLHLREEWVWLHRAVGVYDDLLLIGREGLRFY